MVRCEPCQRGAGCGVQSAELRYTRHPVILGEGRESIGHAAVDRGTGSPAFAEDDEVMAGMALLSPAPSR